MPGADTGWPIPAPKVPGLDRATAGFGPSETREIRLSMPADAAVLIIGDVAIDSGAATISTPTWFHHLLPRFGMRVRDANGETIASWQTTGFRRTARSQRSSAFGSTPGLRRRRRGTCASSGLRVPWPTVRGRTSTSTRPSSRSRVIFVGANCYGTLAFRRPVTSRGRSGTGGSCGRRDDHGGSRQNQSNTRAELTSTAIAAEAR